MAKRRRGRDVSGILVLDKPAGFSSNDAVQKAKRLFRARKVGPHGLAGSPGDRRAAAVLRRGHQVSQYLLASDKKYRGRLELGVATDSGDADGNVVATRPVENVTRDRVDDALRFFRGEIAQVPSMFSAVKHHGQPLYKLARQGIEIEREARRVKI